jgi:hypothetical protein
MRLIVLALFFPLIGFSQIVIQRPSIAMPTTVNEYAIEGGSNASLSFSLGFAPSEEKAVSFVYDTSKITITPSSLTFTPSNHATAQRILVSKKTSVQTKTVNGVDTTDVAMNIGGAYVGKVRFLLAHKNYSELNGYHGVVKYWDTAALKYNVEGEFKSYNVNSLRQTVIDWLYPVTKHLPTTGVDSVYTNVSLTGRYQLYCNPTGFTNLVQMNVYVTNYGAYKQFFYHLIPNVRRNKVVLLHSGHTGGAGDEAFDYPYVGVQGDDNNYRLAAYHLLANGYDVVFSQMPLGGLNSGPYLVNHNLMVADTSATFNPVSVFVDGWVRVKNYINTQMSVQQWISTGLSGGGWTCTMLSAIDTDIDVSFAVAGSSPTYVKDIVNDPDYTGDYEQGGIVGSNAYTFFRNTCSYLDLYVMAAQNRRHYQLLNVTDDCCFWGNFWQSWIRPVQYRAGIANGVYDVFQYTSASHQYTLSTVNYILEKLR